MHARKPRDLEAELAALPPHLTGQIVDGDLVVSPRPARPHVQAEVELTMDLTPFQRGRGGPGGWVIYREPEVQIGSGVFVPDLAGWRVEHLKDGPQVARFQTVPDWVCEILSPSTAALDRGKKARRYREAGVPWMWFVDPNNRTVEVLRGEGAFWVQVDVFSDDAEARLPPFDAIAIDVRRWWGELPADPGSTPDIPPEAGG